VVVAVKKIAPRKWRQKMKKSLLWTIWGSALFIMIFLTGAIALAEENDEFAMPAGSGTAAAPAEAKTSDAFAPAEAKPGDAEAVKNDPGATPADPAEAPGPADSPSGDAPAAGALVEAGGDALPPPANLDESEQVEVLSGSHKFTPGNESKDPFKPLVVKKVILPPAPTPISKPSGRSGPPLPPPPKPIQLFVSGVCGNENERLAMIMFENKPYVVSKDMVVDGKFKIVDILPDRLVIYSNKEQMRRTFPIGGGKR